jgi:hypothetical protein
VNMEGNRRVKGDRHGGRLEECGRSRKDKVSRDWARRGRSRGRKCTDGSSPERNCGKRRRIVRRTGCTSGKSGLFPDYSLISILPPATQKRRRSSAPVCQSLACRQGRVQLTDILRSAGVTSPRSCAPEARGRSADNPPRSRARVIRALGFRRAPVDGGHLRRPGGK